MLLKFNFIIFIKSKNTFEDNNYESFLFTDNSQYVTEMTWSWMSSSATKERTTSRESPPDSTRQIYGIYPLIYLIISISNTGLGQHILVLQKTYKNLFIFLFSLFKRAPFRQRYGYMYNSSNKNVNNYQVIIL